MNRRKKEIFERELKKEKDKIECILIESKIPLKTKDILEKMGKEIPQRTIKGTFDRKYKNNDYTKMVSKYIQIHLYDKSNKKRTLCGEGRVFRLHRDDSFEYKEKKINFPSEKHRDDSFDSKKKKENSPAKKFMKNYWGEWENQVHSYYFATPKTYFIKTKIFDEIIRNIFLESKEISKYMDHVDKIEELLKDAEKLMTWIEIAPNIKNGCKNYESNDFIRQIRNIICEGKDSEKGLHKFADYHLAHVLGKIEKLLSFGNSDYSYINAYRILRKELYEREIFELPKKYLKKKEKFYKENFDEDIRGKIFGEILKLQIQGEIDLPLPEQEISR